MHKPLSEYTDDEIAAEMHRRAMQKLGDQSVSVSWPPEPDGKCEFCWGTGRHQGKCGGPGWPQCGFCGGSGKS